MSTYKIRLEIEAETLKRRDPKGYEKVLKVGEQVLQLFQSYVMKQDTNSLRGLLLKAQQKDPNINFLKTNEGGKLFATAAARGFVDILKLFIEEFGFDPDLRAPEEQTALMVACYAGEVKTVLYLLGRNANPNATDSYKKTPLHYATDELFKDYAANPEKK